MDISFHDLGYSVASRTGETKQILHNITGFCQAGRLLALMGRSGAGKTTLLDVLACQSRSGLQTGQVLVNGKPVDQAAFKRSRCYVMQKDVLLHSATVREALTTSAFLRLPRSVSRAAARGRVEALIQELGLQDCADTLVGDESHGLKGISGGERRRLSMGLELVTQPAVVFLDEPTSGLDSDTALSVVRLLRRLAARSRTVVCTIHQPSSDIVDCFQDLLLLANGRLCYCGPWASVLPFLADAGSPCPLYKNPADFLMTLTSNHDQVDVLVKCTRRLVDAGELPPPNGWPATASADDLELDDADARVDVGQTSTVGKVAAGAQELDAHQGGRPGACYQTWVLLVRFFRSWLRDPLLLGSEVFQYVFFGVSIGLMYLQLSDSTAKAPFNRASVLWFMLAMICFTPAMTAVTSWEMERQLLRRETVTGAYSLGAFYVAKTAVVVPFEIVLSLVFTAISYFMVGLQAHVVNFFIHLLTMTLFLIGSESIGLLCAVATPSATYAIILLSIILIYLLSFSGFLLNEIPIYFRWLPKISYLDYAYVAVLKNELYGLKLKEANGTVVLANSLLPASIDNGFTIWENIAILAALVVGTRLLGFIGLYLAKHLRFL